MLIKKVVLIGLVVVIFGSVDPNLTWAQSSSAADEVELRFNDYEAKIQAILKTRLPEEKEFVTEVMELVRAGQLPERLVETSFKWVQNRHPDTNHPFVYFERVLRIQATKLEIELPDFDYAVYKQRRR